MPVFPPTSSGNENSVVGRPPINIVTPMPNAYSGLSPATSTSTNTTTLQHTYLQHPQISGSMLTSTNSDLERLERLKKEILDGQNPYYQPVSQPDFLENLYLGRRLHNRNTILERSERSAGSSQLRSELTSDINPPLTQSKEELEDVIRDQTDAIVRAEAATSFFGNNQENITGGSVVQLKSDSSHTYQTPSTALHSPSVSPNVSQHGKPAIALNRLQSNDISERVIGNGRVLHSNDNKEKVGFSFAENASSGKPDHSLLQRRVSGIDKEGSFNNGFYRGYGTGDRYMDHFATSYSNRTTSEHADVSGNRFIDRGRERNRDQEYYHDKMNQQEKGKKFERYNENRRFEENARILGNHTPIYNSSASRFITRSPESNTGNSGNFDSSRKEAVSHPPLEDRISRPPGQNEHTVLHAVTDEFLTRSSETKSNAAQSGAKVDEIPLSMPEKTDFVTHSTKTPLPLEARLSLTSPIKKEQLVDRIPFSLEERISSQVSTIGENVSKTTKINDSEVISDTPLPSLQERITNRPSLEERIGEKTSEIAADDLTQGAKDYMVGAPAQDSTKRILNDDKDSGIRSNNDRSRSHETEVLSRRGAALRPPYSLDNRQTSTPSSHMKSRLHYEPARNISLRRLNSSDVYPRDAYRERADFRHAVDAYGHESVRPYNEDRRADYREPMDRSIPLHDNELSQGRQHRFSRDVSDHYGPSISDDGRPVSVRTREYRSSWDRDEPSSRVEYVDRMHQREIWDVELPGDRRSSLPPPSSWDRSEALSQSRPANIHREGFNSRELERSRYPPEDNPPLNARIRPRSPSPLSNGVGHVEDARPFKRPRDTPYYTGPPREIPLRDTYYDRRPPESRDQGNYYESREFIYTPRDTAPQMRERPIDPIYDRRALDVLPPRSPPFHARASYPRVDNRNIRHFDIPSRPGA